MKQKKKYPAALTIAGSDSGGGAGIQADLKTFSSLGLYGTSVLTAVTAQNTLQVRSVEILPTTIVREQLKAILDDFTIHAVKTGMLPTPETVELVAWAMDTYHLPALVVDPVMESTTGSPLAKVNTGHAIRELLYKRLTLITPNITEASILSGVIIKKTPDVHLAAGVLLEQGCRAVLIKGGHIAGEHAVDMLFTPDQPMVAFSSGFIKTTNLHGTGCTLSSAIAAFLAQGYELTKAIGLAKQYVTSAILAGKDVITGRGNGPLNHFFDPKAALTYRNENDSRGGGSKLKKE